MHRSWVFAIAAFASGSAHARTDARPAAPATSVNVDFWKEMLDPHSIEVGDILTKARELMVRPDQQMINGDTEWAVDARARFFRDARNMLAYARTLSPQNLEVLGLLGAAHDELGDTRSALDAFDALVKVAPADKVPVGVAGRLGAIHMRLGELDAAIHWLRLAQTPLSTTEATPAGPATVNLATALATKGDMNRAIDTLANAIPNGMLGGYSNDVRLVTFALAVHYDRDEQRAAAFTTLDGLQSSMEQYAAWLQNELARMRFPEAEDVHYYRGLLYESLGQYIEARAEWAHYAAAGDLLWRGRALQHIAAIDAERRAHPGPPRLPRALAPASQPTRRPHP